MKKNARRALSLLMALVLSLSLLSVTALAVEQGGEPETTTQEPATEPQTPPAEENNPTDAPAPAEDQKGFLALILSFVAPDPTTITYDLNRGSLSNVTENPELADGAELSQTIADNTTLAALASTSLTGSKLSESYGTGTNDPAYVTYTFAGWKIGDTTYPAGTTVTFDNGDLLIDGTNLGNSVTATAVWNTITNVKFFLRLDAHTQDVAGKVGSWSASAYTGILDQYAIQNPTQLTDHNSICSRAQLLTSGESATFPTDYAIAQKLAAKYPNGNINVNTWDSEKNEAVTIQIPYAEILGTFDENTGVSADYYMNWYVLKSCGDGWHIDGNITLKKYNTVSYAFVGKTPDGATAPKSFDCLMNQHYTVYGKNTFGTVNGKYAVTNNTVYGTNENGTRGTWTFDGWYTSENATGTNVAGNTQTMNGAAVTYYGKWTFVEDQKYDLTANKTVTLSADSDVDAFKNYSVTFNAYASGDTEHTKSLNSCTVNGFHFTQNADGTYIGTTAPTTMSLYTGDYVIVETVTGVPENYEKTEQGTANATVIVPQVSTQSADNVQPVNTVLFANAYAKQYPVTINMNCRNLGETAYQTAGTLTWQLSLSQMDSFVNEAFYSAKGSADITMDGLTFFTRDEKNGAYAVMGPSYLGLYYQGFEYGQDGKKSNVIVNGKGYGKNALKADDLKTAAQTKGTVKLEYHFAQIIHYGVESTVTVDDAQAQYLTSVQQIFSSNQNTAITIPATLSAKDGSVNFKGWTLGGKDYTVTGDSNTVKISDYATLEVDPTEREVNGIKQQWFVFTAQWDALTLNASKVVSGLSDSQMVGYTAAFEVKNEAGDPIGTGAATEFTSLENGTYRAQIVFTDKDGKTLTVLPGSYTVSEVNPTAISGMNGPAVSYLLTAADGAAITSNVMTAAALEHSELTVTNTYTVPSAPNPGDTDNTPVNPNPGDDSTEIPDTDTPTTDIPDDQTPTAETPDEIADIPDGAAPLADAPKTGDAMTLWIAAAGISGIGLAWITLRGKKCGTDSEN